jgi:hypothetical protein
MLITINTEAHTVQVHEAANYEELTHLVDTLVEHLNWPADTVQIVERQPLSNSSLFEPPFTVFCNTTDPAIKASI